MKKIAIVIADLDLGGGQRVAINLANALAKTNHVSIIIFHDEEIHYQAPGTAMVFKKAALSVHCNPRELSFFESILVRMTYPRVKNVIAVSEDVASILRSDYGLKNVSRIYNPVDAEDVQAEVDKPFEHPKPYIVALGRFHEVKRYDLLIDAYAKSKMKDDCDLIIVGDGELRDSLENQDNNLRLYGKVHFAGTQSNPFPYLAGAEFLTLSSRTEAFPMVLIEALALECPVVATDCPTGPREIVKHNENGLLVENENVDAFSEALDTLYYNDVMRRKFKKNAIASIQHLSGDVIADEWLSL